MKRVSVEAEQIVLPDAELLLWRQIDLHRPLAELRQRLVDELHWQQTPIRIYGREVMQPRLTAWYGDADAAYRYSGVTHEPLPWHPLLWDIKALVEQYSASTFNSVLCNYYRSGQDSMGWHSDNEPELGPEPVIASLSFGAARRFLLQHKKDKSLQWQCSLGEGDLLLMRGATQRFYRHSVPKTAKTTDLRINLTFRRIIVQ
ncbi:alpha-ketoglutarate-dependent dioxygenase AlkB [Permianibacter aggregans]|nr:alpha-ketoglutarate-dependent dioxygenase AlkB [Permianibacter aggregans]